MDWLLHDVGEKLVIIITIKWRLGRRGRGREGEVERRGRREREEEGKVIWKRLVLLSRMRDSPCQSASHK